MLQQTYRCGMNTVNYFLISLHFIQKCLWISSNAVLILSSLSFTLYIRSFSQLKWILFVPKAGYIVTLKCSEIKWCLILEKQEFGYQTCQFCVISCLFLAALDLPLLKVVRLYTENFKSAFSSLYNTNFSTFLGTKHGNQF